MTESERIMKMAKIAVSHPDPEKREKYRQAIYAARGEEAPPRQESGTGFSGMQDTKEPADDAGPVYASGIPGLETITKPGEARTPAGLFKAPLIDVRNQPIPGTEVDATTARNKFRNVLSEADDILALGLGKRLGKAVDPGLEGRMAEAERTAPLSTAEKAGVGLASVLVGGAPRALGAAGERIALRAVPKTAGALERGAAAGAGAAMAGGGGMAAGQELVSGLGERPTGEVLEKAVTRGAEAATDPLTIAAGAGLGAIAAAGHRYLANNPNVRQIEAQGGRVGPGTPGEGGLLEQPGVKEGIEGGSVTERGIGRVSRNMARNADEALAKRAGTLIESDKAARQAAAPQIAGEMVDVTPLVDDALRMSDNVMIPRSVRSTIMGDVFEVVDRLGTREAGGVIRMPVQAAQDFKRKLQSLADSANPRGAEPHLGSLAGQAKGAVEGSPLGEINRTFKEGADKIEGARRQLGFPEPAVRVGDTGGKRALVKPTDEVAVANQIARHGQDTVTAGARATPELEKAIADFPELEQIMEAVPTLRARSALEFKGSGELPTGGLYEKGKGMIGRNAEPVKARVLAPGAKAGINVAPFLNDISEAVRKRRQEEAR